MKRKNLLVGSMLFMLILTACGGGKDSSSTTSEVSSDITSNTSEVSSQEVITHNVTFKDGEKVIGVVPFNEGDTSLTTIPNIPVEPGYDLRWEEFTLGNEDIVVNLIRTLRECTATFLDVNGDLIEEVKFNVENYQEKRAPEIPTKEHLVGKWEPEVDFTYFGDKTYTLSYQVDLNTVVGGMKYENNKYVSTHPTTLALEKNKTFTTGTISTTVQKNATDEDDGIVFGVKMDDTATTWEGEGVDYFFFFISQVHEAYLGRAMNGGWVECGHVAINEFAEDAEIPLAVSVNANGEICCFVGDECLVKYKVEGGLPGTGIGYRAAGSDVSFAPISYSEEVRKDPNAIEGYRTANGAIKLDGDFIVSQTAATMVVYETPVVEGTLYEFDIINNGIDAGLAFNIPTDAKANFWEDVDYKSFLLNKDGIYLLANVYPTWQTLNDKNSVKFFNKTGTYTLGIVCEVGKTKLLSNGLVIYETDLDIVGTYIGVRAGNANVKFTKFTSSEYCPRNEWIKKDGHVSIVNNEIVNTCDGSQIWLNIGEFIGHGVDMSADFFISGSNADNGHPTVGFTFGANEKSYWDNDNYYSVYLDWTNNIWLMANPHKWDINRTHASVNVKDGAYGFKYNDYNTLRVIWNGDKGVTVYLNGSFVTEISGEMTKESIPTYTGGYVGIFFQSSYECRIKNICIMEPQPA